MPKTATDVGRGHCKFLFIHPVFENIHHSVLFFVFSFSLLSLIVRYIPRQLSRNETPLGKTTPRANELLLGNLRTNRKRAILPSSQSKIEQKYPLH